jgi:glycylpeptide N-tetradecanoyltransferase
MSESKETNGKAVSDANETTDVETVAANAENDNATTTEAAAEPSASGESKRKKIKKLLGKKSKDGAEQGPSESKSDRKLTPNMIDSLLQMNPALASELAGMDKDKAAEALTKLNVADLLTGLSLGNKNKKDMASYKFWQTQPVPRFDEKGELKEGPIKMINPDEVPKEPYPLLDGFEWVTLDLTDDKEVADLYELLSNHYVEDDNAMFRFNYSRSFLNWYVFSFLNR